jgi:hypothetical protein
VFYFRLRVAAVVTLGFGAPALAVGFLVVRFSFGKHRPVLSDGLANMVPTMTNPALSARDSLDVARCEIHVEHAPKKY